MDLDTYGLTAYMLHKVQVYSIPIGFIAIAIGAIYQYVIGIRKMDVRDKGFGLMIASITCTCNMPTFTASICNSCKRLEGLTNESFICCK